MSIDPNKKYVYHHPGSGLHGKPVTQLHRFDVGERRRWMGVCYGSLVSFSDDDCRLREVDPVMYYANHYRVSVGCSCDSLRQCIRFDGERTAIARTATHQSGKIRQIPLDATEDPEAHA